MESINCPCCEEKQTETSCEYCEQTICDDCIIYCDECDIKCCPVCISYDKYNSSTTLCETCILNLNCKIIIFYNSINNLNPKL